MTIQSQLMKKNLLSTPKYKLEESQVNEAVGRISTSELKEVKGFWDATIAKLNENGITTIQQLKKVFDAADGEFTKLTHILTWIQQKQFSEYLKAHPLLIED